ncbi:DUF4062 domain-containing protein [Arthrospiribacter ruber]|nr:DUF4062 domain-containing protein [Arthrospiribacter ruber]
MSYQANVYQVIIASPGDVSRERQLAREIVYEWNSINSLDKRICLLPVGWEHNSSPEMGGRAQEFINKQVLENSDLLIGIFWTRIGSSTGDSVSGSVEEIEKHVESGKPAMLYFSNTPVRPDSIDQKQYEELKKFKNGCYEKGLVEIFDSIDDLRQKLTRQLSLKIIQNNYFQVVKSNDKQDSLNTKKIDEISQLDLTEESKELIIEASNDPSGTVMKIAYKGGFDIQSNGKRLNLDFEPRTRATWQAVIENLIMNDILEERGYKGEVFALTLYGYKIADKLKEK